MDTSSLLIAAFCRIWQPISTADFGYTLSDILGQPVLVGALLGLLTGQVEQGLMIGGSLELMYLGVVCPGGTVPAYASSATLVTIPITLRIRLDAHAATVLAVPFGILGPILWNVKYSTNSTFTIRTQKSVKNGDYAAVTRNTSVYPFIFMFFLTAISIFLVDILAPTLVEGVISSVPIWAMHGIEVAGGILPAIGFAMAVYTIGKTEFLPSFVIGYFLVIYFEVATMRVTVFGTCIALLYLFLKNKREKEA